MAVVMRERPVNAGADAREGPGAGRIAGIQGQRCQSECRFPAGFSRNTWVMLPIPNYQYVVFIGNAETREAIMSKNTSIALGDHFQKFVQELVSQGRFGSTSEVVRAGLRLLEEQDTRLAALRKAIQEGVDSGPAEPFDFDAYVSAREGELKRG